MVDIIGKWTEEKLSILSEYLRAYATIMHAQKKAWLKSFHYIDAFAGSGVNIKLDKDQVSYVKGSVLRAIECNPPFDAFWFIELSPERARHLHKIKEQHSNKIINIVQDEANKVINEQIVPEFDYKSRKRGLVFLDPYGLQINWDTLVALSKAKTFDVLINFSLMGVTRILKRDEPPSGKNLELLKRIMGNIDWVDKLYNPSPQLNIFGKQEISREIIRVEHLANVYMEQLKQCFKFVSDFFIMRNSKNSPLYALYLVSHNETAVKITNDIFKKYKWNI
jgi:three-Cys-motif partner protein